MQPLVLNVNGQLRNFLPNGDVAVNDNGQLKPRGKWRINNTNKINQLNYTFDNAEATAVPLEQSFNDFNQLITVIPAGANGGASSAPCVWLGKIVIDDAHDLVYRLLDANGTETSQTITVYGELHFTADSNDLAIDLAGNAGQAIIKGVRNSDGIATLAASNNLIGGFDAADMLTYSAITFNEINGVRKRAVADISFLGNWAVDPNQGGLVFTSKVVGDITKPDVIIGFAGKFKAIETGFAYFAGPGGTQLAFTIKGQHQWNAAEAKFELSLGFAGQKFLAKASADFSVKTGPNSSFELSGSFAIEHTTGQTTKLEASIQGAYNFEGNRLVFRADVSNSNFDLMLEGKFVYRKTLGLSFQVRVNKTGGTTKTTLTLAVAAQKDRLRTMLALTLALEENKVKLSFEFEVRLQFKGGVWLPPSPKAITA